VGLLWSPDASHAQIKYLHRICCALREATEKESRNGRRDDRGDVVIIWI
jgi:hypothetical protein